MGNGGGSFMEKTEKLRDLFFYEVMRNMAREEEESKKLYIPEDSRLMCEIREYYYQQYGGTARESSEIIRELIREYPAYRVIDALKDCGIYGRP